MNWLIWYIWNWFSELDDQGSLKTKLKFERNRMSIELVKNQTKKERDLEISKPSADRFSFGKYEFPLVPHRLKLILNPPASSINAPIHQLFKDPKILELSRKLRFLSLLRCCLAWSVAHEGKVSKTSLYFYALSF